MNTWRNMADRKNKVLQYIDKKILVIDTETTGLQEDAKIIQFAGDMIDIPNHVVSGRMNVYINPEEPLSEKIKVLTGISDSVLMYRKPESVRTPQIIQFMKDADIIVGYNLAFDLLRIENSCKRLGVVFPEIETMDVLELVRDLIGPEEIDDYKLQTVYRYLYPEERRKYHNALEDVRATTNILMWCMQQYYQQKPQDGDIEKHIEFCYYWENPHKASQKRIRVVFSKDRSEPQNKYIYYDCVKRCWGHTSDKKAEELFKKINKQKMEQQIIKKYYWLYVNNMDELGICLKQRQKQKAES